MLKKQLQAEHAFKNDYLDDFVGLYLFLAVIKKGQEEGVVIAKFKAWYKDTIQKQGHVVLKFNEQFKALPIPKQYIREIVKVSALADKINAKINQLYNNRNTNIDKILKLIQQVNAIIKSAAIAKK